MKFVHNTVALVLSASNAVFLTQAVDQGGSELISRELTDVEYPDFRFTNWDTIEESTKEAAIILGYEINTWDKPGTAPIEMKRFDQLDEPQKLSAQSMGFDKQQWDCYQNHYSAYTWNEMRTLKLSEFLIRLGWTRESWEEKIFDEPNSQLADVEWRALTSNQQIAARELCYFQETWNNVDFEEWECRREHYRDYTWDELKLDGIDQLFMVLGWNEEMWSGNAEAPPSESMAWDELTTEQHIAARKLCYLKEEWNGPPYPTARFKAWSYLTDEQKSKAESLGYSSITWNKLQSEEIEALAFGDLSDAQKEAATGLGFNEKVWDCYINHYEGYFWYELKDVGVEHWMVVLGWDSSSWTYGSAPNSEITFWDDLSVAQKTAAKEICYIEESWNEIMLDNWDCAKDNFMDRTWDELKSMGVQQYFLTLGWTKTSWLSKETPAAEDKAWGELTTDEADAARAICFEKENWDGAETFYPANRYHVWDLLDNETQAAAGALTYTRDSWNSVGSADIEDLKFDQLSSDQQVAAQKLGFEQQSWDCWQNHYFGYLWSELSLETLQPMTVLGYTMEIWDSADDPEILSKKWKDLTSTQRDAAQTICYFQETWERTNLEEWECPKNHFADLSWSGLQEAGVQDYFDTLGWTEDSWGGSADPPPTEDLHWDQLSLEQHVAAMQICFTKSVWESAFSTNPDPSPTPASSPTPGTNPTPVDTVNVPETAVYPDFRFRVWSSLSPAVKNYARALSYDEDKWNNLGSAFVEKIPFNSLGADEQHAAIQLGFKDALSWNCYMNHYLGFTWDQLEEEGVQAYYVVLGYSEEMWKSSDEPQSKVSWNTLNGAEQTAAQALCYIKESWDQVPLDRWECSWNHFTGRTWDELEEIQMQHYFVALGWDEASWTSGRNRPASESKHWNDLSADEEAAARAICFEKESWDDPSEFYPILRYKLWDLLENDEQASAEVLAYDKNTWNNPGTADIETMAFDEMSDIQKKAARRLQFKEDTWDCWQNHYEAFKWKELQKYGTPFFLTVFGWTQKKWDLSVGNLESVYAPSSWTKSWTELSGEEQNAGKALCYIEQTWDKLDLNDWDCSRNHYDGYSWDRLKEVRVQGYFETLGWTEDSWNGKTAPPRTQSHHWTQLNKAERLAARQLCYSKSVWDSYFVNNEKDGRDNMAGIISAVVICVAFVGLVGALQIWGLQKRSRTKEEDTPNTIPNDVAVQV